LDEQGRERERCFCFAMPENFAAGLGMLGRRAVLGVNVRQDQPARYDAQGARLYGVRKDGPAGEAGLEEGDVVTRLDGKSLLEPLAERDEDRLDEDASLPVQRMLALLDDHEAGDSVSLEYLRDGDRRTATVVLEEPRQLRGAVPTLGPGPRGPLGPFGAMRMFGPDGPGAVTAIGFGGDCPGTRQGSASRTERGRVVVMDFGRSCVAGVELLEMRAGLAQYFGAAEGGVLVADAADDNPLGLRAGDVLVAIGGREVRGADQALRVLRSYERDEELDLRVLRRQQTVELKGRLR
jgi:S1-C subfamily serine protease